MAITHFTNLSNLISVEVEEYLNTTYRPDVDYVDGEIEERNLGEFDHADLQTEILMLLRSKQKAWNIRVVGENRVQVATTRFRIPDVCVIAAGLPREPIIRTPPLLCVEVLSPRDTLKAMRKRCQDYLDMGVPVVWIFNPETRTVHVCTQTSMVEHHSGTLRIDNSQIELTIEDAFATLDA